MVGCTKPLSAEAAKFRRGRQNNTYHISSNCFRGNYSFLNLEIAENSNGCHNILIVLLNKLIFCCKKYLNEETIQGRKL